MTQRNMQVAGEISSLREQQLQCNQRFPIMFRHLTAHPCNENGEQFTNTHNVHTQGPRCEMGPSRTTANNRSVEDPLACKDVLFGQILPQ